MKAISLMFVVLLVSAVSLFAAPANGTIESTSVSRKGDSIVVMIPIDLGQYFAADASKRINLTDKWIVWAAFDKDSSYTVEVGKDVSVMVEGVVTADGNYIRAAFPILTGYKGHIVWSAYQAQKGQNVPIWVNCGYHNKPGIAADKYGWMSSDKKVAFYHTNL